MKFETSLERCASALLVVAAGVLVGGTKACQENYDFASQSNVPSATGTAVNSATPTPTPTTSGTVSLTPSGSPVAVGSATATRTATPMETGDPSTQGAVGGDSLFNQLSALSEGGTPGAAGQRAAASVDSKTNSADENWLGEAFSKDGEGSWADQDRDGYSDVLEEEAGTNPQDASSAPKIATTKLSDRIRPQDVELESDKRGDDSHAADGATDSLDSDMDGIPDEVEVQRGTNPNAIDSDSDGIRDDREIILGTNPLRTDSDGDGISDALEYSQGSDPTIPEQKG